MARFHVDIFTLFRGNVVAEGWCEGAAPQLLYDGREVAISCTTVRRADLAAAIGPEAEFWGFRLCAALPDFTVSQDRFVLRLRPGIEIAAPGTALPDPTDAAFHAMRARFLAEVRERGGSLIEIGSRARSGNDYRSLFPPGIRYVGTDVTAGPNVDVVADAHHLSRAVSETFDFAFSIAVFEHLFMPWKAALELNAVLKEGASALIVSHHAWPLHEEPWDFWRYSKEAWRAVFNRHTGFEVEEAAYERPASVVPNFAGGGALHGVDCFRCFLISGCRIRKTGRPLVAWDAEVADVCDLGYSHA